MLDGFSEALIDLSGRVEDKTNLGSIIKSFGYSDEVYSKFSDVVFPFALANHQINHLYSGLGNIRFGLFDEARTGKTAIMQSMAIFFSAFGTKSIFLMPPSLFTQFERDLKLVKGHNLTTMQFTFSPAKRIRLLKEWETSEAPDILIMSKEVFLKHGIIFASYGHKALFWDECHMGLAKESNKIYGAVKDFSRTVRNSRLILSTGTPFANNAYSQFPIISLKTPEAYKTRKHFNAEHVTFHQITVRTSRGDKLVQIPDEARYRQLDLLSYNLRKSAVRVTKEEVLSCSAPNVQIVPIELDPAHYKLYRQVLKERLFEVDGDLIDARADQKLRQVAMQLVTDPETASEAGKIKTNAVLEAVKTLMNISGIDTDEKIVIFANYNRSVELIAKEFAQYNPATVYGQNGPDVNRKEVTRFQEDNTCRILVANPISGGTGIKAGEVSSTVIFAEPVSTPGQFDQAASRVMLIGKKKPVVVYILQVLNTISPSMIDLMMGKANTMLEVTKDKKSVFDTLLGRV